MYVTHLKGKLSRRDDDRPLPGGCHQENLAAPELQKLSQRSRGKTELFDLIGFERIELIQLLLEHRDELVREHALNKNNMKQEIMSAAASKLKPLQVSFPEC